jgi:CRP/FNR family cyclic AMP-dependent transcriptional regulator
MPENAMSRNQFSQADAARLLVTESALGELSLKDAMRIVAYMRPKRLRAGQALVQEGEKVHTNYMMLILSGDVQVESETPGTGESLVVSVVGAGSLIGEMGLLNGSARTATCVAGTDLVVAVLTREGLRRMLSAEPDLAARFLLAMSSRLAERLRETTDKLKRFVQLTGMLQREVFMLMDARPATTQPPPDAALLPTRPAPLDEPRRRGGGRPGR